MTGKGLRQNTIKMPSKYADMSTREIEYGGGNTKKILGWILIGAGIAAAIGGVVCIICACYNCGKYSELSHLLSRSAENTGLSRSQNIAYCTSYTLVTAGVVCLIAGAVCITGGCILKNSSDRSCVVSDFGPHAAQGVIC